MPKVSYPHNGNDVCFSVEDRSFWFKHRNDCIAALVSSFPPSGTMLDVGGGNGYVARRLLAEGLQVVLLEPGERGVHNAKVHRGLKNVIHGSLEDIPPRLHGTFGAIGLFDVIEHIEDQLQFIAGVSKLLKPAGLLYLTAPAYRWLWSLADSQAGHYRRYTLPELETALSAHFRPLFATYMFQPLVLPIALLRSLPYILHCGRQAKTDQEHIGEFFTRCFSRFFGLEVKAISRGKSLRWGASCLLAARLKDHENSF